MTTRTFSQAFTQNMVIWLKRLLPLLLIVAAFVVLDRVQQEVTLTTADAGPVMAVLGLALGGFVVWSVIQAAPSILAHSDRFAWRMGFRFVGWIGIAGTILGIAILLRAKDSDPTRFPLAGVERAVEFIIPLAVGLQAAFLFSPDDEPSLEVLLACPRPISWLLLERLLVLAAIQTIIALLGVVASLIVQGNQDVFIAFVRWISPALFFGGIGIYTTWRSRQPAFGVAIVGLLWFVSAFLGTIFMPGMPTFWPLKLLQPFLWSLYPYLQPGLLSTGDYGLNRILLGTLGLALVVLTARQLRSEESILLGSRGKKSSGG